MTVVSDEDDWAEEPPRYECELSGGALDWFDRANGRGFCWRDLAVWYDASGVQLLHSMSMRESPLMRRFRGGH